MEEAITKASHLGNHMFSRKIRMQITFIVIAFFYAYAPVLLKLVNVWWNSKDSSHGFLVPFISIFIAWTNKDKLRRIPIKPDNLLGIPLALFAGFIFILGEQSSLNLLQELSLVVMIAGIVLMLLGMEYLKALLFPISYLLFMIPVLGVLSDRVHWPFQLFSAKLGTRLLDMIGIPVFLESQYIEMPNVTLEVAAECSGLRYLMSIIAIGVPLAYFTQKTVTRKIMLVSTAVLVAIIANAVRIAFIGVWAYYFDAEIIHGPFHIFQGFLISMVGFVALFAGAWFFSKMPLSKSYIDKQAQKKAEDKQLLPVSNKKFSIAWLCAIIILGLIVASAYVLQAVPVPPKVDFASFSSNIGDWKWDGLRPDQDISFKMQNTDKELFRTYKNAAGEKITLFLGYLEAQHQGKELVNYYSKELHKKAVEVEIPTGGYVVRINRTVLLDGDKEYLVSFWYDLAGRKFASLYKTKLATISDAFIKRRTNGAVVMIISELKPSDKSELTAQVQQEFIKHIVPVLDNYL